MPSNSIDFNNRLNQIGVNIRGTPMKIIKYNNNEDISVLFLDKFGYIVEHATYRNFILGYIKNPYDITCGVNGYLGVGKYTTYDNSIGKPFKSYNVWRGIHMRANNFDNKHPAYKDVVVCEEWYNYQNFASWYYDNYYEIDEDLCIDKDLIQPNSRIYSPETCCLIPNRLNEIFHNLNRVKKSGAPIGIEYVSRLNKPDGFRVKVTYVDESGVRKYIRKTFDYLEDAKKFYSNFKQNDTRRILKNYKNKIPDRLYKIIYDYDFKY